MPDAKNKRKCQIIRFQCKDSMQQQQSKNKTSRQINHSEKRTKKIRPAACLEVLPKRKSFTTNCALILLFTFYFWASCWFYILAKFSWKYHHPNWARKNNKNSGKDLKHPSQTKEKLLTKKKCRRKKKLSKKNPNR